MGVDERVAVIAGRQLGLFRLRQAEAAGATKGVIEYRVRTGRWVAVRRGVYRINGTPGSFEQDVLAACLSAGEGAVASYFTATRIWGLSEKTPSTIELSVPAPRRAEVKGVVVHRVRLSRLDVTTKGIIPITSPFRSVLDLAGAAKKPIVLESAFDTALRRQLITIPRLISQMANLEGATFAGIGLLRRIFDSRIGLGIPESELETHFVNLLDRFRVPQPPRQQRVRDGNGLIGRVDFFYPDHNLVIECYGAAFHSTTPDMERDLRRGNAMALRGITVLRFSWSDVVVNGRKVCEEIADGLGI